MIEYVFSNEYVFEVVSSNRPPKKIARKKLTTMTPILYHVKDEDNRVFRLYHRGKLGVGRKIRCMVNGFNKDGTPKLVLALNEHRQSKGARPDATTSSARLIYTPMGNKR